MKIMTRLGLLAVMACLVLLTAGCPAKRLDANAVPAAGSSAADDGITDRSLPILSGESLRAADEITNAIIYFDFDKFSISAESKQVLTRKAELMKRYPQIRVSIQGNCDDRGTEEYNLALGERRARAAYEFLVMSGVAATQMEVISYGKLRPAVQGNNEAAWAKNRRDDFVVLNPRGQY